MALTPFGRRLTSVKRRAGSAYRSIRDGAVGASQPAPRTSLFGKTTKAVGTKRNKVVEGSRGGDLFGRSMRAGVRKVEDKPAKKFTPEERKAKQEQMKKRKGQQKSGPTRARASVDRTRKVGASDKGKSLIGR